MNRELRTLAVPYSFWPSQGLVALALGFGHGGARAGVPSSMPEQVERPTEN